MQSPVICGKTQSFTGKTRSFTGKARSFIDKCTVIYRKTHGHLSENARSFTENARSFTENGTVIYRKMHGHLPKTARSFTENARSFFGKRTVISKNTQSFFYFHRAFLNGISAGRCLQPPLEAERSATVGRWAPLAALVFSVGAQSRAIASEHTQHMLSVYSIPRHFPTTVRGGRERLMAIATSNTDSQLSTYSRVGDFGHR